MKWIVILAMVAFFAFVVYSAIAPVAVECEVCLDFDGRLVCRSGAGATEEDAIRAAQESACGGNVSGMSESIACRAAQPASVQCSTGG